MKTATFYAIACTTFFFFCETAEAQNTSPYWSLAGNSNASPSSKLGTTGNTSLRFYTNNVQRMIINSVEGYIGIGTPTPNSKVHINSASGQIPLRAQVNASTKFLVSSNGGVAIGSGSTPPSNGLYISGNLGIGTSAPENKLHIFKGSAGSVTGFANAPLVVESSTNTYINLLAPDASETGFLFGKPANNISGEIVYNNAFSPNGLQFRTNGPATTMVLTNTGSLGVGTLSPEPYKAKISHGLKGLDLENASSLEDWELVVYGSWLQLYYNQEFRGEFSAETGAYLYISDERLKTNVKPMSSMLGKIKQLKPSTYQFKNATSKQEHSGFIAQDVMKIFPDMVAHNLNKERNLDVYTMDYSGFGVLAIKGIQELQPIIEEQNEEIATLKERINKLEAALASINANNKNISAIISNASLEQNQPNPFNKNTIFRYSIPQGSKGQLNIYDQAGKLVKALKANESGQTELSGYNLPAGTYTYTLMINGKLALSKQMLIVK